MPTIKALINRGVDNAEAELIAAANAATPAGVTPRAFVERDAAGKVVKVLVNLPEGISHSDLSNAKAAIAANNGVASVGLAAQAVNVNFDSLIPGDLVNATPLDLGAYGTAYLRGYTYTYSSGKWTAINANENISGVSLSSRGLSDALTPRVISGTTRYQASCQATIDYDLAANGLSNISGMDVSFKVKIPDTKDGQAVTFGDVEHTLGATFEFGSSRVIINTSHVYNFTTYQIRADDREIVNTITPLTMTRVAGTEVAIRAKMMPNEMELWVDGVSLGTAVGPGWYMGESYRLVASGSGLYSTDSAIVTPHIVIDDLGITHY